VRRCLAFALAVAAASVGTSCDLLRQPTIGGPPPPSTPLGIATSAVAPNDAETIFGEMRVIGPCLTLVIRDGNTAGPSVLPIWPVGFSAKGGEGEGIRLAGPMEPTNDAINSERLELHGEYIDVAPADASIPRGCEGHRLFLVGRVRNVAT
jgi:hypothetical protein